MPAQTVVVGTNKKSPLKNKRVFLILLGIVILVALGVAGFFGYKWYTNRQQKTPETLFKDSSTYKSLSSEQKLNVELSTINQMNSVGNYKAAQVKLEQIKQDYPGAEKSVDFLVRAFIINMQAGDNAKASDYARKIKGLNTELPKQYQMWKDSINEYAAK